MCCRTTCTNSRVSKMTQWKMETQRTYRTDPISAHNQIHNSLRAVLERNSHSLLAQIFQANELLVELDQTTRGFLSQGLLQDKTFHPACPIRITRVVRNSRIDNLAGVGIPGTRRIGLSSRGSDTATLGTQPGPVGWVQHSHSPLHRRVGRRAVHTVPDAEQL